jgi:disulfide oxidoreductase YuzD
MLESSLKFLACLLAAYGLISLVIGALDAICARKVGKRLNVRVVLLVQDAEKQIEHIVRNAVGKKYASGSFSDKKLAIVDMNSKDNTLEILEKLESVFPGIEVLAYKDKDEIFNGFSAFSLLEK